MTDVSGAIHIPEGPPAMANVGNAGAVADPALKMKKPDEPLIAEGIRFGTSLTDGFLGTLGIGGTLSGTFPNGGTNSLFVPFQGLLEFTPPGRMRKKATYTPITGTLAGKEQIILCSEQSAQIEISALYEALHMGAVDAAVGLNGGTITLTLPDGTIYTGVGGIEKNAMDRIVDSKEITDTITIALNAGWTLTT